LALVVSTACACGRHIVPVVPNGIPDTGTSSAPADPTFEVVARIAGARDPLPVGGTHVSFADLETALNRAVLRAVRPRHDSVLTVELIHADATYSNTRLSVVLVVRATLRTRYGDEFVAQKQVICRDGAIIAPDQGAAVIWSCMTRLGQDLGGWLDGLSS
jgi:hypothetical protein